MSEWTHHRAKIAALTRSRQPDDPELLEARRNLRAARIREYVEAQLAKSPPLTDDQRTDLARMFSGSSS